MILAETINGSLKSNMDRFIVYNIDFELTQPESLKSNMDRFIETL